MNQSDINIRSLVRSVFLNENHNIILSDKMHKFLQNIVIHKENTIFFKMFESAYKRMLNEMKSFAEDNNIDLTYTTLPSKGESSVNYDETTQKFHNDFMYSLLNINYVSGNTIAMSEILEHLDGYERKYVERDMIPINRIHMSGYAFKERFQHNENKEEESIIKNLTMSINVLLDLSTSKLVYNTDITLRVQDINAHRIRRFFPRVTVKGRTQEKLRKPPYWVYWDDLVISNDKISLEDLKKTLDKLEEFCN